jgi:hypothetical protein
VVVVVVVVMMMMMWRSRGLGKVLDRIWKPKLQRVYYELEYHEPWFDKECSKLLDQRKQAKLQCLQNPSQTIEITWTM